MNFLAHHVLATRLLTPTDPLPFYVVGVALPDLLPLAGRAPRLRRALLERQPAHVEDTALQAGVLVHLATDAAFHKTVAFADAQADAGRFLDGAAFEGIRVRRFFVAHVLTELALDAVLLRDDPTVADDFYSALAHADRAQVTRWAEAAVGQPLPGLPAVLTRFARSRYLYSYGEEEGVAAGLSHLCARARQDTFEGENFRRLVAGVGLTVDALKKRAAGLLAETEATLQAEARP